MSNTTYNIGQRVVIVRNNDNTDSDPDIKAAMSQNVVVIDFGDSPDEYVVGVPGKAELGNFICTADELAPAP